MDELYSIDNVCTVCSTEYTAEVMASEGKAEVVYEGADLSALGPEGPRDESGPYLLYVSSLNPFKRPDSVVRALGLLRREGFDPPRVRFVGRPDPADRARVLALAREEAVADRVAIEGVVPHDRLPPLYRGATALVYPSALETFGLPPLEAMACGRPVVASNRTSVPEIVGDAGVLVDPDDVPALAAAIRRVTTDEALRSRLRSKGFRNVLRFDWADAARSTLDALRRAATESSTRASGAGRSARFAREDEGSKCTSSE